MLAAVRGPLAVRPSGRCCWSGVLGTGRSGQHRGRPECGRSRNGARAVTQAQGLPALAGALSWAGSGSAGAGVGAEAEPGTVIVAGAGTGAGAATGAGLVAEVLAVRPLSSFEMRQLFRSWR